MDPIMMDMLVKAKYVENNHTAKLQIGFSSGQASDRSGFVQKLVVILSATGVIVLSVGWVIWTL